MHSLPKVCVVGLGYIGLPTSCILATKGFTVTGVDINPSVVERLNNAECHIVEPGLPELLKTAVASGQFKAQTTPVPADVFLIIVPTPFQDNHQPDMTFVRQAAASVASMVKEGDLVVLESTSPVGATRTDVMDVILAARPELKGKLSFAFCPERAIPGDTLRELVENDRSVGGVDAASTEKAAAFYGHIVQGEILKTTADTAEMVKLVENSFRDTNIAFANELSLICNKLGLNVWDVIRLANHHPRVNILQPGPGVGGHCIAVDPWFIVASAPKEARLIHAARTVNDGKPQWVLGQVSEAVARVKAGSTGQAGKTPKVAALGLAFKSNVDDLRESPALHIAKELAEKAAMEGYTFVACDPFVPDYTKLPMASLETVLAEADVLVMLTDHAPFYDIPTAALAGKEVVDTRGVFDKLRAGVGASASSSAACSVRCCG